MSEWIVLFLLTLCVLGLGIYNLRTSIYSDHATIGMIILGLMYKSSLSIFKSDWMLFFDGFVGLLILSFPLLILGLLYEDSYGGGVIKLLAGIGTFIGIKMALFF